MATGKPFPAGAKAFIAGMPVSPLVVVGMAREAVILRGPSGQVIHAPASRVVLIDEEKSPAGSPDTGPV